jgi:O-antigen/teichoic acid export membrane protein
MSQNELDYPAIRRRVEEELRREKARMRLIFFFISLLLFVIFIAIGWGVYLANGGTAPQANIPGVSREENPFTFAMTMITAAGFINLVFQLVSVIVDTKRGERQLREQVTGRIINKEIQRLGLSEDDAPREKAKRLVRLGDDGELEEVLSDEEVEIEPAVKTRRR